MQYTLPQERLDGLQKRALEGASAPVHHLLTDFPVPLLGVGGGGGGGVQDATPDQGFDLSPHVSTASCHT